MTLENLAEGEFALNGARCKFKVKYLPVQNNYWLIGDIKYQDGGLLFDEQKKTPYEPGEIKKVFEDKIKFSQAINKKMPEIKQQALEQQKLIGIMRKLLIEHI
jgi:hypothetical protein